MTFHRSFLKISVRVLKNFHGNSRKKLNCIEKKFLRDFVKMLEKFWRGCYTRPCRACAVALTQDASLAR